MLGTPGAQGQWQISGGMDNKGAKEQRGRTGWTTKARRNEEGGGGYRRLGTGSSRGLPSRLRAFVVHLIGAGSRVESSCAVSTLAETMFISAPTTVSGYPWWFPEFRRITRPSSRTTAPRTANGVLEGNLSSSANMGRRPFARSNAIACCPGIEVVNSDCQRRQSAQAACCESMAVVSGSLGPERSPRQGRRAGRARASWRATCHGRDTGRRFGPAGSLQL